MAAALAPQGAAAQSSFATADRAIATPASESIDSFYAARGYRPLWLETRGPEPMLLFDLLSSAAADGLDPEIYPLREIDRALGHAQSGDPRAILHADRMMSEAFVAFVRDQRQSPKVEMIWVDPQLRPAAPSPRRLLDSAAAAPSLEQWLRQMQWMHPIYAGLRAAIANRQAADRAQYDLLRLNLERARALPAPIGRHIVVDAAAARLTMYADGKAVDSMRVVVGKPVHSTPMMAALIRFTSLNPYWNVPPDLAAERVAPNVVKDGIGYLTAKGYQLMSSWDDDAVVIDPASVDWSAVAAGRKQVRLRQLPGPSNAMGKMKFMFPNAYGIYLHDTPDKDLLTEESRMFSGGCVRLEDAPRLARWLYGGRVPTAASARPEQRVDLRAPVPVFLTYLTAMPTDDEIAFLPDVYNRDRAALSLLNTKAFASR